MEHSFLKGKNCITKKEGFSKFQQCISGLCNDAYLSLLLKGVIEEQVQPFDEYFHLLLKQGADINFTQSKSIPNNNEEKANLLMIACMVSNLNVVEVFLGQQHISIFQKDKNRRNIVHYAIENKNQEEALDIVQYVIGRHPQFRNLSNYEKGSFLTLAIQLHKPSIVQYLISEDIDCEHLKGQSLILHKIMEDHKTHKRMEMTVSMLRVLLAAGCREDILNEKEENYLNYAINRGLLSQEEMNELMRQLKPENQKKQLTLETSPEEKVADFQHEEDFWDNSTYNEQEEHDIQVFFQAQEPYEPNHVEISHEMLKIALQVQEAHAKTWATLYPYYLKLYYIVSQMYGSIQLIGSFASNLWIPNCDIDFLLIIPQNNVYLFDDIVHVIFSKVKKLGGHSRIKLYLAYKLPMIKLILSKENGGLEVELFLSNKKNIATQYVFFVHEIIAYYPEIQVIYYVIRKILQAKSLHDHKNGGLKAYGLFLLIYTMRNHYKYTHVSQFLQHFAYYYGIDYQYVGQLVEGDVNYKINIIDPLNSQNNMGGKKTDILSLQEVFKKVYYGLNMENEGSKIAFLLDLIKDI